MCWLRRIRQPTDHLLMGSEAFTNCGIRSGRAVALWGKILPFGIILCHRHPFHISARGQAGQQVDITRERYMIACDCFHYPAVIFGKTFAIVSISKSMEHGGYAVTLNILFS